MRREREREREETLTLDFFFFPDGAGKVFFAVEKDPGIGKRKLSFKNYRTRLYLFVNKKWRILNKEEQAPARGVLRTLAASTLDICVVLLHQGERRKIEKSRVVGRLVTNRIAYKCETRGEGEGDEFLELDLYFFFWSCSKGTNYYKVCCIC